MELKKLFTLGDQLPKNQGLLLSFLGLGLFIVFWWVLAESLSVQRPVGDFIQRIPNAVEADSLGINVDSLLRADSLAMENATDFIKSYPILPRPDQVFGVFGSLVGEDNLIGNSLRSIWLNIQGYIWAVVIAVPIGFVIGLFPIFRGLFGRQVDALRYLPLTALTGLFIIWFGLEDRMKIAFLAFGIIVYLLPVVIQRIDEVKKVYLTATHTLGASNWQMIKTVYIPAVFEKLIDDIRVLTAISWTYIIIAELLNKDGGIGALIYMKARQGQFAKVFAILIVIILIGFLQDRIFAFLDRRILAHKYDSIRCAGHKETLLGIFIILGFTTLMLFVNFLFDLGELGGTVTWLGFAVGMIMILWGEFKRRTASTPLTH